MTPTPVPYPRAMERWPRIRQSLLSTFDSCNYAARLDMNRVGWAQHHHARGSLFHRVAAECIREMLRIGESSIEPTVALAVLHDLLRQDDVDRECPLCGGGEIRPGVADGRRQCAECEGWFASDFQTIPMREVKDLYWMTAKWARDHRFDPDLVVDVEQRLEAMVEYPNPLTGGHVERRVTGQLDVLELDAADQAHAIIKDWKTAWAVPPQSEISSMGYFQQRMYALLVLDNYPSIQRVTLDERYVRFNEARVAMLHRADVEDLRAEFGALVERWDRAFEEELWTPSPGAHCSYCPAPHRCPIERGDRGAGTIRTAEEAERAARVMIVADAARKQAQASLREWAKVHGPIPVKHPKAEGKVLGFKRTESVEKPDLDEVLAAPQSMRAALWGRRKVSTRFGLIDESEAFSHRAEASQADADAIDALEAIVREREADASDR